MEDRIAAATTANFISFTSDKGVGLIGLEDEVDQHWDRLVMGAMLSTVIGIGAELGSTANDSAIASALRQGSSNSLNQTGQQITQRNLNIQPTLTIRLGFPVRVIISSSQPIRVERPCSPTPCRSAPG
jgi:type IV secretory pathway VirB10-like protein